MAIETDTERSVFFDTDDFGSAGTFTHSVSASSVNGILEKDFNLFDVGGSVDIGRYTPRFSCRSTDVSTAVQGDTMAVSGTTYTIRAIEDEGTGITRLVLEAP